MNNWMFLAYDQVLVIGGFQQSRINSFISASVGQKGTSISGSDD
jgi:hypothetical protein